MPLHTKGEACSVGVTPLVWASNLRFDPLRYKSNPEGDRFVR